MSKKTVYSMVLFVVLMGVLGVSINVHKVEAPYPIIFIRADGSIDPSTANITRLDNVTYTFTADINASIIVEKDNIIVDGAGYTVNGTGSGTGVLLSGRSNVTIKNMKIKGFYQGILLSSYSSNNTISGNAITNNEFGIYFDSSSNNTISGNNITNNSDGIWLYKSSNNTISGNGITTNDYTGIYLEGPSSNNIISGNSITENNGTGIYLYESSNNTISGNNITYNQNYGVWLESSSNVIISGNEVTNNVLGGIILWHSFNCSIYANNATNHWGIGIFTGLGIALDGSFNCSIFDNNATNNQYGIWLVTSINCSVSGNNINNNHHYGVWLLSSSNNRIIHNIFINNTYQIYSNKSVNTWDGGYPSGGNYWSNYTDVDQYSGQYQNETGSDGIWDTPYVIDQNNQDNYPIVPEFPSFLILPLFMIATLLAVIVYRRQLKKVNAIESRRNF